MPIKPENRHRYPANWPAIREAIVKRASDRCEHPDCRARNYSVGYWQVIGGAHRWLPVWGNHDNPRTYSEARAYAAEQDTGEGPKATVIVLTVAHLDHQPENCAPENLRALCQRHHLAHDHHHHRTNAQATRRAKAGTMELPL